MKQINLPQIDWQKIILYSVIVIFIIAYTRSCNENNVAVDKAKNAIKSSDSLNVVASIEQLKNEKLQNELSEQKKQYSTIEKSIYEVSGDLVKLKNLTDKKVIEAKIYTDVEMQSYFDSKYSKSVAPVIHLDSLVAKNVIVDLEVGSGAIKSNIKLLEQNQNYIDANENLKSQNTNLTQQNENSLQSYENEKKASEILRNNAVDNIKTLKKERRNKTLWKIATIPAFLIGVFIAK